MPMNAIIPDSYNGSDYQKVQSAINDAVTQRRGVEFDRLYDITGSTVTINKTLGNRIPLRFYSNSNGGIRKTDSGYIFIASNMNTGDIFVDGMTFESVPGAGTIVYKAPSIIRIHSNLCSYNNMDTIVKTEDRGYMQSMRFSNESITGGKGYAFDFGGAYDCSWNNVVIEQREHGFIHRESGTDPDIYNCRIRDSVLEGLSGTAIQIKNSTNLVIDGCYFEANTGGHIIINSESTKSITISNCRHGGVDVPAFIVWNGYIKGFSYNNTAQNIAIHNTTGLIAGSEITSVNDFTQYGQTATYDPTIIAGNIPIYRLSPIISKTTPINDLEVDFGPLRKSTDTLTNISLNANQIKKVTFSFQHDVSIDDVISIQTFVTNNKNVTICSYYRDNTNKKNVIATIKNEESSAVTIATLKMTKLRLTPISG